MFKDLTKLASGKCDCYEHGTTTLQKSVKSTYKCSVCAVPACDIFICCTSCKDKSPQNPQKAATNCYNKTATPGGSAQTFQGMLEYMEVYKPSMVIWENVTDVDKPHEAEGSDLDILKKSWRALRYGLQVIYADSLCFGLPTSRKRLYIVACSEDSELFSFGTRAMNEVLNTLRLLVPLGHRHYDSASNFLLKDDDDRILKQLEALEKSTRTQRQGV